MIVNAMEIAEAEHAYQSGRIALGKYVGILTGKYAGCDSDGYPYTIHRVPRRPHTVTFADVAYISRLTPDGLNNELRKAHILR